MFLCWKTFGPSQDSLTSTRAEYSRSASTVFSILIYERYAGHFLDIIYCSLQRRKLYRNLRQLSCVWQYREWCLVDEPCPVNHHLPFSDANIRPFLIINFMNMFEHPICHILYTTYVNFEKAGVDLTPSRGNLFLYVRTQSCLNLGMGQPTVIMSSRMPPSTVCTHV